MANGMRFDGEQIREMPLHIQEQVAMSFVHPGKGITEVPLIPGNSSDYNIAEMAFHNGEECMKEKTLAILMDRKSKVKGEVHTELVDLIEIIRNL